MPKRVVIMHYHEIALKGQNRPFFERALLQNARLSLGKACADARIVSGRIFAWLTDGADEMLVSARLKKVFGIANYAFASQLSPGFDAFSEEVLRQMSALQFNTFAVASRRSDKSFPLTSQEINVRMGALICERLSKKVDLEHPDITCFIEIVGKDVFLYFNKEKGYGGLPVGVSGKALSLISSGFDSPVASWAMMRRGCTVEFIHFHSYPSTSAASQENVKELVRILASWQGGTARLHLVPFLPTQKVIATARIDSALRVVLYRRMMVRIAEHIARKEQCGALVTGDSLGQVASQTMENIATVSAASTTLPIIRPLIAENKEIIIDRAREIETFDASSRPYEDCCSLFVPEHPETRANPEMAQRAEEQLDVEQLIADAISGTVIHEIHE